jgi:hypothetical protein
LIASSLVFSFRSAKWAGSIIRFLLNRFRIADQEQN